MSSRPCVGCAWRPSPALITATPGFTWRAIRCGAPDCEWRTMNMSASIACRFHTVSSSVSPLVVEEAPTFRLMTSAESLLAAISKVVRVRVEFSKNTLKIDLPRSNGTFFTSRSDTETNWSAVSRMWRTSSAGSPSVVRRCLNRPSGPTCRLALGERLIRSLGPLDRGEAQLAVVVGKDQLLVGCDLDPRADEVRRHRQLAPAAVGEHGEAHRARAAEVEELVQRRAQRPPGVQHVVDQHHLAFVDVERDLAAARLAVQPDAAEVVAMQRDREDPERRGEPERAVQPLGDPRAPGVDAHQRRIRGDRAAHAFGQLAHQRLGVGKLGAHPLVRAAPGGSSSRKLCRIRVAASASTSDFRPARVRVRLRLASASAEVSVSSTNATGTP